MEKFKNKLYRFMWGRYGMYGTDTLNKVLLWVYFAMMLVYIIVGLILKNPWFSVLGGLCVFSISGYSVFRLFSKNVVARRRENERFCGFFKLRKNKFRDRKTHIYRKCPGCRVVLRLPRAKGKHTVVCPKCRERFTVKGK